MSEALVDIQRHDGTAVLTLAVPRRRNMLTAELVTAIASAYEELEADPNMRCVVLTGAGSAFCAGADLGVLAAAADGDFDSVRGVYDGFLRVMSSPLVTIAAVHGPAVGAGFNLALACDIRLACPGALFDTRFARLRIHPGGGHVWLLARAVGKQQATLATLFGETWDADAALAAGLVAQVLPNRDALLAAALNLGARLDDQEQVYTRRLITTIRMSMSLLEHGDALAAETEAQQWSTTRPAFRDGVRELQEQIAARTRS